MRNRAYRDLIRLLIADELDDVDCSMSTLYTREAEIVGLATMMAEEDVARAQAFVKQYLSRQTHFASGAPRVPEE